MVRVNEFIYGNKYRVSGLQQRQTQNFPMFRANILEKNPAGIIADLSAGNEVPGIKRFTIGKDLFRNIMMLFTYNHQGKVNGKLNAEQGTPMYSSLVQLAKNMKRGVN